MAIEMYRQTSIKISYNDEKELNEKLKTISGAVGNLKIEPTTPDATDTKQWVIVYYMRRE